MSAIRDEGWAALPIKLLLTVDEAAHALSIKRTKLHELTVSGEIESIKIGASRRYVLQSLEAFIERQCRLQKAG
jgi:excisionase family DNA binding protein